MRNRTVLVLNPALATFATFLPLKLSTNSDNSARTVKRNFDYDKMEESRTDVTIVCLSSFMREFKVGTERVTDTERYEDGTRRVQLS